MSVREYVGARYVPIVVGEWDKTHTYEPLMVVTYQGNSYTSRQYVPADIEITDESYWVLSANYNAQVDAYRREVQSILPYDETPTKDSTKGVTSDGIKKAIDASVSAETTRATAAEKVNADAISMERDRALIAEQENATAINNLTETATSEIAKLKGAAYLDTTPTVVDNSSLIPTSKAVYDFISRKKDQYPIMLSYSSFTNKHPNNVKLYCSYDFINFMDCGFVTDENGNKITADTKNVCITNNSLYLITSGVVYKATDNLRKFNKITDLGHQVSTATGLTKIFGLSLYYDTTSGFIYTYCGGSNSTDDTGFKIYGCRVDNDTLNLIGSPNTIDLQGYDNVIDPFVTKHNNVLYMAFKDETTKKVHIATGTSPLAAFTPNEALFSHFGEGFEGPKLIEIDDRLIMFVDGYGVRADGNTRTYASPNDIGYFQCNGWFNIEKDALCNIINFSRDIYTVSYSQFNKARHPCYFKLTNFVKNLFDNTEINPIMVKTEPPYSYMDTTMDSTDAKYIITNAPMLYRLTGASNVTVGYSPVFNKNCITYIEKAAPKAAKISIDSSIAGGADTGRYICDEDREICSLITYSSKVAYPNHIYYQ